jgi:hypothetical protein
MHHKNEGSPSSAQRLCLAVFFWNEMVTDQGARNEINPKDPKE